jgi:hypothetical protein
MTPTPHCGSPAAKGLGCTCPVAHTNDAGKQQQFVPLSCPVHSPFYKQPEDE